MYHAYDECRVLILWKTYVHKRNDACATVQYTVFRTCTDTSIIAVLIHTYCTVDQRRYSAIHAYSNTSSAGAVLTDMGGGWDGCKANCSITLVRIRIGSPWRAFAL